MRVARLVHYDAVSVILCVGVQTRVVLNPCNESRSGHLKSMPFCQLFSVVMIKNE